MNGGAGLDVMDGGAGNDIYHVDNVGDQVIDAIAGQSNAVPDYEIVNASVTWALGADTVIEAYAAGCAANCQTWRMEA